MKESLFIGVAGWTIPKSAQENFAREGAHLERYSRTLPCVEINSSFYREHQPQTYERWAADVPEKFQFSVKLSKYFTQEKRLKESGSHLREVVSGISALGKKWRILLVQLPPSLEFDTYIAESFIDKLLQYTPNVKIVWEPRHRSWRQPNAIHLLSKYGLSKVLADPEPCRTPLKMRPLVEGTLRYLRLHGSPLKYRSAYSEEVIGRIASSICHPPFPAQETWCIFDNTTLGHGIENALQLKNRLNEQSKL